MQPPTPTTPPTLTTLPTELLLNILHYLDTPDLLSTSRVCHPLRHLSLDPILHAHRLASHRVHLASAYPSRPPLSDIRPPTATIYLNHAHVMARDLSRKLISIRLRKSLSRRPSASSLVQCNVLPAEVYVYEFEYGRRRGVAPSLLGAKRRVERERVKDCLRGWLEGRVVSGKRRGEEERERSSVRELVRRFRAWAVDDGDDDVVGEKMERPARVVSRRWGPGSGTEKGKEEAPTRARVLGLRRFWEGLASPGI